MKFGPPPCFGKISFGALIAAMCAFGAEAAEWSKAVTLTEDVTDAVTLDGEVEVTVASGSTVTISGAISDKTGTKGKIKLTGGGTLVLATANAFSGGADVDTGVLQVLTGGALGTGDITVRGDTKAKSQLQFGELDAAVTGNKTITFPNNIIIENSGSTSSYQLRFGPHNETSGNRKTLELSGDIVCNGVLYFQIADKWTTAGYPDYRIKGDLTADGLYLNRPSIDGFFEGKVTVGEISAATGVGLYGITLSNPGNRITKSSLGRHYMDCGADNVLGGMAWVPTYAAASGYGLRMKSYSQVMAYMDSSSYDTEAKKAYLPPVTATGDVTLTLTGGVSQATFEGSIGANISLAVEADEGTSFEQVLTGDLATMDGLITVNRGKLTFSDAAKIPTDGVLAFALNGKGMIDLGGRTYIAKAITINGVEKTHAALTHETHPDNIAEGTVIKVEGAGDWTVETDMTKDGDWDVFVGDGLTCTVAAQQTGSGKIVKTGTGVLVLKAKNTFTGGLQLDAGIVTVAKNGALGDGDVTIAGATANDCQLRFDTVQIGEASTVANKIMLAGDSGAAHQAIFFDFPTVAQTEIWTVTFTGGITAAGDLYFGDNHGGKTSKTTGVDWSGKNWVKFDCAIDAAGQTVGIAPLEKTPGCTVDFNGKVTAETFSFRGYTGDSTGGAGNVRFNAANEIGTLSCAYNFVYATANDALGDATINIVDRYSSARTTFYLDDGTTQHVKSLKTVVPNAFKDMNIIPSSSGTATLVIDGASADSATAYFSLQGGLSLVVDAQDDAFTQTLMSRSHTMTGSIAVKRGKLVIDGDSEFTGVPTLAVSNGATVKVEAAAAGILVNQLSLAIETGAVLDLPSDTFSVRTLTVDGKSYRNGSYTKERIPALPEGVTLTVTAGSAITAAEWTGAAGEGDTSTATLANWTVDGKVPTADDLPLDDGSLVATLVGGTGMTYGDGDFLNCLTNDIEITAEMKPFVLAPATPDACLKIRNGFVSDRKAQVVLSGRIAAPADATGDTTLGYFAYNTTGDLPAGTLRPEKRAGKSIPLVLNGVTLDLPLSLKVNANANTMFAKANTTNDLNGFVGAYNYSAYFSADAGAVIRFNGGFTAANAYHFMGPGEYQITAAPVSLASGALIEDSGKMVLDAEGISVTGNGSREGLVLDSGSLEFRRSNCLAETVQLSYAGAGAFAIEFNQTTQRVGRAHFDAVSKKNGAKLNGAYPAMLEITGATRTGADETQLKDPYCSAQVTGGLGFHMMWADKTLVLTNRAFASCGNLEASAGTLELAAGATWRNGTNFVARGTGTLKFDGNRQAGKDAVLRIEGSGRVEIADGKRLKVAECWVDGTKVETGVYVAADLKEGDPLYGHLSGGTLCVGPLGAMLLVK